MVHGDGMVHGGIVTATSPQRQDVFRADRMTTPQAESPGFIVTDGVQAQVTSALRRLIVSGQLQPGEALSEAVLARRYGVSRTPVREALKQLEREHLVQIIPRVGTYVHNASTDDVLDGLIVEEALEGIAARLAAGRPTTPEVSELDRVAGEMEATAAAGAALAHIVDANRRFHDLILRAAESPARQFHLGLLFNQFRVPHPPASGERDAQPARPAEARCSPSTSGS
jgi:DNA-binding GntR family transcriptional regulator